MKLYNTIITSLHWHTTTPYTIIGRLIPGRAQVIKQSYYFNSPVQQTYTILLLKRAVPTVIYHLKNIGYL